MIPVRAILAAALKSRTAWETATSAGFAEALTDYPGKLFAVASDYYARDATASSTNLELLETSLERSYTNPKHRTAAIELLHSLASEEVSVENVSAYLAADRQDRAAAALAAGLAARRPRDETDKLLEAYIAACASGEIAEGAEGDCTWAEAIRSRTTATDRLQVTPRSLNERLGGGLLPGTNVTIFGRPESGKSALALTLASGFARRGLRVLYVGNEDPIQSLMVRAVSNLTGKTLADIEADPDGAEVEAVKRGAGNLIFKQLAPGTLRELDAVCKAVKPAVLIVDQIRNISIKGSENFTQNLDTVARGIRAIGIRHHAATIGVCQAGDSASGKARLGMGDIDSSNTGIPGAADILIGVGVTESLEAAGMRYLSLPKNKLTGTHEGCEVRFNSSLSKMESQ